MPSTPLSAAFAGLILLGGCALAEETQPAPEALVAPPCVMVVQGVVTDRASFAAYARALPPLYERFGGSYLVVARAPEVLEGAPAFESLVISRWPSCEAARAFWLSPDYRALAEMRQPWGRFDVVIAPAMPADTTAAPMAVGRR